MSKFEDTMRALKYTFDEQDGKKLTYKKGKMFTELALVIDLEAKTINPILIPTSLILYKSDIETIYEDFKQLREDAKFLSDMSEGKLIVLNGK